MATLRTTLTQQQLQARLIRAGYKIILANYLEHTHFLSEIEQSGAQDADVPKWDDAIGEWKPGRIDWAEIVNKPSTFSPSPHSHPLSDLESSGATAGNTIYFDGTNWKVASTLYIDEANGRVGIGTTSPSSKLEVIAGSGVATSILTDGFVRASKFRVTTGTESYPAFAKETDPDTGLNLGGSDRLGLATAGQYRLFINANGDIGIGTTSPQAKLEVYGGDIKQNTGTRSLIISNGSTITGSNHLVFDATNSYVRVKANNYIYYDAASGHIFGNYDESLEWVRITSSGRVGIGTSNPVAKLEVYDGDIVISNDANPATLKLWGDRSNIDDDGRVDARIAFRVDNSDVYGFNIDVENHPGKSALNIAEIRPDGNYSRLYIDTSGNIGVGTTNPAEKLHVVGNVQLGDSSVAKIGLKLARQNAGVDAKVHLFIPSTNSPNYQLIFGGEWTAEKAGTALRVYSPYIIGIAQDGASAATLQLGFTSATTFTASNLINVITLLGNGNVGIGTTTPQAKLDVNGKQVINNDIEFTVNTAGPILIDRTTGTKYRLYVDNGVLGIEAVA